MPKQKKSKKKQYKQPNINLLISSVALIFSISFFVYQLRQTQTTQTRAAITNCTVSATDYALDSEEQKFVTLVNQYRQTKGAGPLKISPNLSRSAAWHSRDMANKENMDHTDSLGRDPGTRMDQCGYNEMGGENIAYGYPSAAGTLKQWQSDVPHDSAMTDKEYKVFGIARAKSSSGDWYWTYDVGDTDDSGQAASPGTSGSTSGSNPSDEPSASQTPDNSQATPVPSTACLGSCPTPSESAEKPANEAPPVTVPTVDPGSVAPPTDPGADSGMPPSNDSGSGGDISNGNGNGSTCRAKRRKLRKKRRKLKRLKRKKTTKKARKKIRKLKKQIKKLKRKINNRC